MKAARLNLIHNTCSEVLVICFQINVLTFQFKISQVVYLLDIN